MSPRRPPRDPEGLNRVLNLLGVLLLVVAVAALGYGAVTTFTEVRADRGDPGDGALAAGVLTVIFTALGIGCLRLSRDDGSGTWCEECIARNDPNAPLCELCGAELP